MAGGGGAGYNIPVSLSLAESTAQTQTLTAGTTFNFASPYARGDVASIENTPVASATATSAAAQRDASAATSGSGVTIPTKSFLNNPTLIILALAGIVVLVIVFLWTRKG